MGTIWKDTQLLDWSSQLYHSKKNQPIGIKIASRIH